MFTRRLIQLAPDAPAKAAGAPPPPPPIPAPAAVPAPAAPSGGDNAFAEIDAAFTKAGDVEPPAGTPPKEPTPPKPEPAAAPAKPAAAAAPPSPKPPEPKPGDVQRTPKELRAELERTKAEFETHKATTAQLEAKIKDYEAKGKDTDALRALVESRDKELETIRGEIRALKQEASPEFKAKYDVPFNLAAKYAENVMKGIVKTDGAPADFDRDFVPLYRMPFNAALQRAEELFGDKLALAVMQQVQKLQELDFERREAFEEEKRGWADKQKQEDGLRVQQREQIKELTAKVRQELADSVPAYKDPVDDTAESAESAALRKKGYEIFDTEPKSLNEALLKDEHARHRVAAFGPNQLTIKRQSETIAQLRAEIENLKGRQPNPDPNRPAGSPPPPPSADDAEAWAKGMKEAAEAAV